MRRIETFKLSNKIVFEHFFLIGNWLKLKNVYYIWSGYYFDVTPTVAMALLYFLSWVKKKINVWTSKYKSWKV